MLKSKIPLSFSERETSRLAKLLKSTALFMLLTAGVTSCDTPTQTQNKKETVTTEKESVAIQDHITLYNSSAEEDKGIGMHYYHVDIKKNVDGQSDFFTKDGKKIVDNVSKFQTIGIQKDGASYNAGFGTIPSIAIEKKDGEGGILVGFDTYIQTGKKAIDIYPEFDQDEMDGDITKYKNHLGIIKYIDGTLGILDMEKGAIVISADQIISVEFPNHTSGKLVYMQGGKKHTYIF